MVVTISVTNTIPITNKSKAVNGITVPPIERPSVLTGAGNPRSSAAQIMPAADCRIPKIPRDAITGTIPRIAGLANIAELLFPDKGRITSRSTAVPSVVPTASATKKATQYEYPFIIRVDAT